MNLAHRPQGIASMLLISPPVRPLPASPQLPSPHRRKWKPVSIHSYNRRRIIANIYILVISLSESISVVYRLQYFVYAPVCIINAFGILISAILEDDVVRYSMVKKKGYVQLATSHGNLNLELFCDVLPKTCENFIKLTDKGYYDGTIFHRSIRNFIVSTTHPDWLWTMQRN